MSNRDTRYYCYPKRSPWLRAVGAPSAGLAHFSHRELPIRGESVAIDGLEPLLPHVLLGHE